MNEGFHERRWWEVLLLGGLFALALLLRGWELGRRPATPGEAVQAWAAWRGGALPSGGSPLLAGWNATVFAIFGPDDGWMRSGAALAGALGAVALWIILRPRGLAGAVGAAWLWVVSPVALMASRFLDGGSAAASALAMALALWRASSPSRWVGLGIALGVGAAAGPAFWTGCVMLLPVLWLDPPEIAFPRWKILGVFGLTALLVGSWGGWRGTGAREVVDGLSAWLMGFTLEGLPVWWEATQAFLRGEMVTLALGLAGGILAIYRRDRFGTALMMAAGIGILFQLLRFSAPFTEYAVLLLPWVLLSGLAVQWLWETAEPIWRSARIAVLEVAGVGGIGLGTIAAFMNSGGGPEEARWLVLLGVLGLLGLGVGILGGLFDPEGKRKPSDHAETSEGRRWVRSPAVLGIGGVITFALVLGQITGATALVRRTDSVPGLSFPEMTDPAVREVVEELRREAARQRGWPGGFSVVVVAEEEEEAFWRWILRGFEGAVDRYPPAQAIGDVWLTPEDVPVPLEPEQWVGRPFLAIVDREGAEAIERRMVLWVRIRSGEGEP